MERISLQEKNITQCLHITIYFLKDKYRILLDDGVPANPDLFNRIRKTLMYRFGTIDIPVDDDIRKFFQRRLM